MVIRSPYDYETKGLHPNLNTCKNKNTDIKDILIDFEKIIMPNLIKIGWHNKVAKTIDEPYNNNKEQNLNGHLLPGLDVIINISKNTNNLNNKNIRNLISLWIIHDIHKIVDNNSFESKFNINKKTIKQFVYNLELNKFSPELTIDDYKSSVVALHDSDNSKLNEQTNKFSRLRPYLKLTDGIMSIKNPEEFNNSFESNINTVFNNKYKPISHTVDFDDSIVNTLVNKSIYNIFKKKNINALNIRKNGILYISENNTPINNTDKFINKLINEFLNNLKDVYQVFKNESILGSNINSPENIKKISMPRVYEISDVSKLLLSNEEIITRIIQASIRQQNCSWKISKDSKKEIQEINKSLDINIPQDNPQIEGLAAAIHTIYREILPKIVENEQSNEIYEKSRLSALVHILGIHEDTQNKLAKLLEDDVINTTTFYWPYKYILAYELYQRYNNVNRDIQKENLIKLLLNRLSDFKKWEHYGLENEEEVRNELYLLFATKVSINGEKLHYKVSNKTFNIIDKTSETGNNCIFCDKKTNQPPRSLPLLSFNDYNVLDNKFSTYKNNKKTVINPDKELPEKSICSLCQFSISVRSQQFKSKEDSDVGIHVTIHPSNSYSRASYYRYRKILKYIKNQVFSNKENSISYTELSDYYKNKTNLITQQHNGIYSITSENQIFDIGTRLDPTSSILTLPDNSDYNIIKGILCASIAGLICGVKVNITKYPQINFNKKDQDELINFGEEIGPIQNLFNNNLKITKIPNQIQIINSVLKICSKTTEPSEAFNIYVQNNQKVLNGSNYYKILQNNNLIHKNNKKDIARICISIDSLTMKYTTNYNYLSNFVSISRIINESVDINYIKDIYSFINDCYKYKNSELNYLSKKYNISEECLSNIIEKLTDIEKNNQNDLVTSAIIIRIILISDNL